MTAPKYKSSELAKLYSGEKEKDLHDKKLIEALKQRLNEKLRDPQAAKKAALIIESWLNQKKR